MLFLLFISLCLSRVCQSRAPTLSLIEELRFCRRLNYPFCVETSSESLRVVQKTSKDLPSDLAHASTTEVSAMAVLADRYLVQRYAENVDKEEPSQACLHFWNLAVCAETFSKLNDVRSLCYDTCRAVQSHCNSHFLTHGCEETLKVGSSSGCTDYAVLTCNNTCNGETAPVQTGVSVPGRYAEHVVPAIPRTHHLKNSPDDDEDNDGDEDSDDRSKRRKHHKNDASSLRTCEPMLLLAIAYFCSLAAQIE